MAAYLQGLENEDMTTGRKVAKWYVAHGDGTFDGPYDTEEEALDVLSTAEEED